ncbi:MAG TPA: 4-hydroxythreonine-4-phosphate dehydrogenase PdxA [Polyangiales bacterium]
MTSEARVVPAGPVALAVGDPCGVGPLVSVRAALLRTADAPIVLFGDLAQLRALAETEGAQVRAVAVDELHAVRSVAGCLHVCDTGAVPEAVLALHAPQARAGEAQLVTLRTAASAARAGQARALVTGPTSKAAIVSAGHAFVGQTEFLAALDAKADDAVTMLFLGPKLCVALVTTHLALSAVPGEISALRVQRSVRHLTSALQRARPGRALRVAVSGLNPHAGEAGLFGPEELRVIAPALAELGLSPPFASGAVQLSGPVPAEAVFRAAQRGDVDGVVAMFHDQATIASKLLDWGAAVNTTWGLSFLRTSVDHGVAYDAAAQGTAEHAGMLAALDLALRLTAGDARG